MNLNIKKPQITTPFNYSYSVSPEDMEKLQRKKKRAEEIGIRLFVLDDDAVPKELQELEDYIIDNYLDNDLDIPDELKKKYSELKQNISKDSIGSTNSTSI